MQWSISFVFTCVRLQSLKKGFAPRPWIPVSLKHGTLIPALLVHILFLDMSKYCEVLGRTLQFVLLFEEFRMAAPRGPTLALLLTLCRVLKALPCVLQDDSMI